MSPSGSVGKSELDVKPQSDAKSKSESQNSPMTCEDLLGYTEEQLVSYLKKHDRRNDFDLSDLVGVESLSESQREDLAQKVTNAASKLLIESDDPHAPWQGVASVWEGSPDSTSSNPPPITVDDVEVSSRQELIRDGGHPVCSIEELLHILHAPWERYEAILSWLNDEPEKYDDAGELKTVFSRQFWRWWEFRKSQWNNRGLGDSEAGFSAFLEACKRQWEGAGETEVSSDPSIHETVRQQWQHMSPCRLQVPPNGDMFSAHSNAVKIRLAPYSFNPLPQLRRDPQKQTAWTNWLEYLSFELDRLNTLNDAAESCEPDFHRSVRRLIWLKQINQDSNVSVSDALEAMYAHRGGLVGKPRVKIAKQLAAARVYRDAHEYSILEFIQDTNLYTQTRKDAMYQRHRVEWVVEEARLLEAEKSQQRKRKKRKLA